MKLRVVLAFSLFLVLLLATAVGVQAVPPLPVTFWGVATVDGTPAPLDTPVVAWVAGQPFTATRAMSDTVPAYVVSVGGADSWGPTGGAPPEEGATITFTVGGLPAAEQTAWHQGERHADFVLTASQEYSEYDLDQDGTITVADIMSVAALWRCQTGDACYDAQRDTDDDGDIDVVDIMMVASRWGCQLGEPCYYGGSALSAGSSETDLMTEPVLLSLEPANMLVEPGSNFTIDVQMAGAVNLGGFELVLRVDPALLRIEDATSGSMLAATGRTTQPLGPRIDNENGTVRLGGFSFGTGSATGTEGILASVVLSAQATGSGTVDLEEAQLTDMTGRVREVSTQAARVTVSAGEPRLLYLPLQLADEGAQVQQSVSPAVNEGPISEQPARQSEPEMVRGPLRIYLPVLVSE